MRGAVARCSDGQVRSLAETADVDACVGWLFGAVDRIVWVESVQPMLQISTTTTSHAVVEHVSADDVASDRRLYTPSDVRAMLIAITTLAEPVHPRRQASHGAGLATTPIGPEGDLRAEHPGRRRREPPREPGWFRRQGPRRGLAGVALAVTLGGLFFTPLLIPLGLVALFGTPWVIWGRLYERAMRSVAARLQVGIELSLATHTWHTRRGTPIRKTMAFEIQQLLFVAVGIVGSLLGLTLVVLVVVYLDGSGHPWRVF